MKSSEPSSLSSWGVRGAVGVVVFALVTVGVATIGVKTINSVSSSGPGIEPDAAFAVAVQQNAKDEQAAGKKTPTPTPTPTPKKTEAKKVKKVAGRVIRNLATGYCVDLPGSGAVEVGGLPTQQNCVAGAGDNQDFEVVKDGDAFLLRNIATNLCLDAGGQDAPPLGTMLDMYSCLPGDGDNQRFRKEPQGAGFYLVNVKSGLCLDVNNSGGPAGPGAALTLYTCSPNDDHIWTFGTMAG